MPTEITRRNIIVEYESRSEKFRAEQRKLGKETKGLGNIFSGVKGQIAAFLTVGAAFTVLKDASRTISEFQQSVKGLSSLTGLTGKPLDDLSKKAIELSKSFGTSAKEIVDGFAKVGSAAPQLLDDADALAEVTRQADILSKAAGISLDDAIGAVTKSMNQYGIEAKDASKITDILATSQQKGTATIVSLTESLKNVGSVAAAQNISLENTNAHLQALAKGGLEGAEAGTKLRSIYLKLAATGRKELNPATQDFNDILKVLGKEVTTLNKAQKIFGEESAAAALTLIKQSDVVAQLTDNLNEQGNAMQQAATNTDTTAAAADRAAAAWDGLILSIDKGDGILSRAAKGTAKTLTNLLLAIAAANSSADRTVSGRIEAMSLATSESANAIKTIKELGEEIAKAFDAGDDLKFFELQVQRIDVQLSALGKALSDATASQRFGDALDFQEKIKTLTEERIALQNILNGEIAKQPKPKNPVPELEKEIITLAVLKQLLKEANDAREQITEGDTKALKANEKVILGLQKRIDAYKIEKKETERLAKERKDAANAIAALNIALLDDGIEKQVATLKLQAKIDIENAKGTAKQIGEQRILIEKKTAFEIAKLRREEAERLNKIQLDYLEQLRKDIDEDNQNREDEQAEKDARARQLRERGLEEEVLAVKKSVRAKALTEEEGDIEIAKIHIESLKAQLNDLDISADERIQIKQRIVDAEIGLEKLQTAKTKEEYDERKKLAFEALRAVAEILSQAFDREAERIAKSIELQEDRVRKAREIAGQGNAEILQLEEQRLRKLNAAREAAAKKQRSINAIQIAANSALAVSQGLVAVISGFKEGNVVKGVLTAVTLAATIAAAISSIKGALSDVPAFATGVDSFKGVGTSKSDSNLVRISTGERIVPAASNGKLKKLGVTNDNIVRIAAAGVESLSAPQINNEIFQQPHQKTDNTEIRALRKDIKENTRAIESIGVTATIDHKGFEAKVSKRNKLRERRKNMLR